MKYIWLMPVSSDPVSIESDYCATLDDINSAVHEFVEKHRVRPDSITMHHSQLSRLYSVVLHNRDTLTYLDNGEILILTYLGKVKLNQDFNNKSITSTEAPYILVENKEAQKVDNILLGYKSEEKDM